ncbi:MAG: SRPBCC domain-containing protein [Saprospiraceae bacterium]|nr:SRPBCC domain-containing protein [Saprospiraceae bacterium]MDZ4705998.1 SRPBCC domain-containing protein [Saprospiraceae bacterium]
MQAKPPYIRLVATGSSRAQQVYYTGDVKLSGMLSTMGGRVIATVAKMLAEQFFEALEKEAVA